MIRMQREVELPIRSVSVRSYVIPTTEPEADGTIEWRSTTLVLVEISAGGKSGLGFTYASKASAEIIAETLKDVVVGQCAWDIPKIWQEMIRSVRNLGRPGAASLAISAVDLALWDLKAKLLELPLHRLLGRTQDAAPIYGSGGFTSYSIKTLQSQLAGWAEQGIFQVKMKIGAEPSEDFNRVRAAREAIGRDCELFVDANGAYSRKQALNFSDQFESLGVRWFEEPVSSDDREGLRLIRDRASSTMEIAAGEYSFDAVNLRRLLEAGAVDVLQIDSTRCLGITGFLQGAAISGAHFTDISSHCAPSMHVALACATPHFRHIEYFFDHARIEEMLFEGALKPIGGKLKPDPTSPGFGLVLKEKQAAKFAA
jgi:L-alanine-DL-glutamate epimerase-like enolase superfamily enzyme